MKKALKIISLLVLLVIIALIAIPYIYKDEIETYVKTDINKNFNAVIDYESLSLSLFKDFPNLNIALKKVAVDGIDRFQDVQLASLGSLNFSLNAKKAFLDKDLEIKKIKANKLDLNLLVLKNGEANYNILKENPNDSVASPKSFELKIKEYEITNSNIQYDNQANGMTFFLKDFNHSGSGRITDKAYELQTRTEAEKTDLFYGIHYINEAKVALESDILIEEDYNKYTFENSDLTINDLEIALTKSFVYLKDDDIEMDFTFQTKQEDLKQMLSLVPANYLTSLENVSTNGNAILNGFVKGIYNKNSYPAYGVDLVINNGTLKHPDLPETLSNINLISKVAFSGGKNLDKTTIDLPKIHFTIADNFVDGKLRVDNPMSDPLIQTAFKSKLDLEKLINAIKITGVKTLKGKLDTDFSLNGRLSAIERKQYDKFKASGFLNLNDFTYKSDAIPHTLAISKANMTITPQALQMENLQANIGENDFQIKGNISNYIAYLLSKDKVLKANFNMHSNQINLNDFMSEETTEATDASAVAVIKIPKNIELSLLADATNLIYKDMDIKDVKGTLNIKDGKAVFDAVLLKTLDGEVKLNGNYDSSTDTPVSNLDVDIQKMSIVKSASTFSAFQAYAPILQKIQGDFFSDMKMDIALDNQMNPVLNTLKAQGSFNTNTLQLQGIDIVQNIGSLLKINALENPTIDKIKTNFSIENGTMSVKPFTFKLNDINSSLKGTVNLDKQIDFVLSLAVPREMLGANPNALLEGIVGKLSNLGLDTELSEIINMNFKISGDYNKPKIFPSIAGYEGASMKEVLTEVVKDKVDEVVTEVVDNTRIEAQKQADKILAQAQQQADTLVSKANKLGITIRKEAQVQGDNLIAKAKNPLEKIGANVAAKKINQEADKKANLLVVKAQEQADLLLSKAQEKADKLLQTGIKE